MSNNSTDRLLADLLAEVGAIADDARRVFGGLTARQINWEPGEGQWSVGQCFDHLITSNRTYYPTFEKVIRGEKKNSLWESMPVVPGLFGRMLIKSLAPDSHKKFKAAQVFKPSSSAIDADIISRFAAHQGELMGLMEATAGVNLHEVIVTSPVSRLITYSLIDCYRIIITHEKRHFLQAKRVLDSPGFPNQ